MLALTFRSKVYFELTVVYGVRYRPKFILMHVDVQLSQRHWLKGLTLTPLNHLSIRIKKLLTINVRVYFWILKSTVDLSLSYSLDNYHFIVNFEINNWILQLFFFFNIVLAILDPLQFHMNFRISLFISRRKKKKHSWNFAFNMSTISGCIRVLTV